ncbi:MAG: PepSY domain-containing protein [archaeon]
MNRKILSIITFVLATLFVLAIIPSVSAKDDVPILPIKDNVTFEITKFELDNCWYDDQCIYWKDRSELPVFDLEFEYHSDIEEVTGSEFTVFTKLLTLTEDTYEIMTECETTEIDPNTIHGTCKGQVQELFNLGKYTVLALITRSENGYAQGGYAHAIKQFHYWPDKGISAGIPNYSADKAYYNINEPVNIEGRLTITFPLDEFSFNLLDTEYFMVREDDISGNILFRGASNESGEVKMTGPCELLIETNESKENVGEFTCPFEYKHPGFDDKGKITSTVKFVLLGRFEGIPHATDALEFYVGDYPEEAINAPETAIEITEEENSDRVVVNPSQNGISIYNISTDTQREVANNSFRVQGVQTREGVKSADVTVLTEPTQRRVRIISSGTQATSTKGIEYEDNKLYVKSGTNRSQVKVMPIEAVSAAQSTVGTPEQITLDIENNKPVYKVKNTKRQARIFGLITTEVEVETTVNAVTGAVESTSKPWWATIEE